MAALVGIDTFERLRKSDEEFERLRGKIPDAFAGQPGDEVRAIVDEAVAAARDHRVAPVHRPKLEGFSGLTDE